MGTVLPRLPGRRTAGMPVRTDRLTANRELLRVPAGHAKRMSLRLRFMPRRAATSWPVALSIAAIVCELLWVSAPSNIMLVVLLSSPTSWRPGGHGLLRARPRSDPVTPSNPDRRPATLRKEVRPTGRPPETKSQLAAGPGPPQSRRTPPTRRHLNSKPANEQDGAGHEAAMRGGRHDLPLCAMSGRGRGGLAFIRPLVEAVDALRSQAAACGSSARGPAIRGPARRLPQAHDFRGRRPWRSLRFCVRSATTTRIGMPMMITKDGA
jgi:hypothetical protein